MDAGFFRSRQFIIAAVVAAVIIAGAVTAFVFAERYQGVGGHVSCDEPRALGVPITVIPVVERESNGRRVETTYDVNASGLRGGLVSVCGGVGEVMVTASPDGDAHLVVRVTGDAKSVDATVFESRFARLDDGLVVQAWAVDQATGGGLWGFRQGTSVVVVVELPATDAYDVDAKIDVGDVTVSDLLVGDLTARTDVGAAKALRVDLTGNATMTTEVGKIILAPTSVQEGSIRLTTDVDDIEVDLPQRADVGYDVTAQSDVGGVTVELGPADIDEHERDGPGGSAHVRTKDYDAKPTKVRMVATSDVGSIRIFAK